MLIENAYAAQDIARGAGGIRAISTLFIFAIEMWQMLRRAGVF